MYRINYSHLLFRFIPLIAFLAGISACSQKKEIVFRYSDETPITDSLSLKFLERQLMVNYPELLGVHSLDAKTFLDLELKRKLDQLITQNGKKSIATMLVQDNETGTIVYCRNSKELSVDSQQIRNTKLFGMLLSFEEGVKLSDVFAWTGKQGKQKYEKTVASLYRITPPSTDYRYPYDAYSCLQWAKFMDKLEVRFDDSSCVDDHVRFFPVSLMDLVKTGSLIQRNGSVRMVNLFEVVVNKDEGTFSPYGWKSGLVVSRESCTSVKEVLKPAKVSKIIEFKYRFSVHTAKGILRGMIVSTKTHTIGFLSTSDSIRAGVFSDVFLEKLGSAAARR